MNLLRHYSLQPILLSFTNSILPRSSAGLATAGDRGSHQQPDLDACPGALPVPHGPAQVPGCGEDIPRPAAQIRHQWLPAGRPSVASFVVVSS